MQSYRDGKGLLDLRRLCRLLPIDGHWTSHLHWVHLLSVLLLRLLLLLIKQTYRRSGGARSQGEGATAIAGWRRRHLHIFYLVYIFFIFFGMCCAVLSADRSIDRSFGALFFLVSSSPISFLLPILRFWFEREKSISYINYVVIFSPIFSCWTMRCGSLFAAF